MIQKYADKIIFFTIIFILLSLFGYYLDTSAFNEAAERIERTAVVVRDTIHDTTYVRDTIIKEVPKYITSVSYTTAYPPKLDTLESYKGDTGGSINFGGSEMGFETVNDYKIMCNGRLYEKKGDPDDEDTYHECNGEWIITIKGTR